MTVHIVAVCHIHTPVDHLFRYYRTNLSIDIWHLFQHITTTINVEALRDILHI
jgi:hypothetical protein